MVQRNGVGVVAEKYLPHYCLRGERERASAAIPSYLCIRNVKNAKSPYPTLVAPTFGYLLRASTKSQKIVGLICRLKDHCSLSKICSCCLSVFHLPRPTTRLNRQSYSQPFPLPSSAAPAMFKVVFKATMCCLVACPSRPFLLPLWGHAYMTSTRRMDGFKGSPFFVRILFTGCPQDSLIF